MARGNKNLSPSGSQVPTSFNSPAENYSDIKDVVGKERKAFLKKISKCQNAYLDQIKTYSFEQGIETGLLFSSKRDIRITAINEVDVEHSERTVRKVKGSGEKMFAHCSWSSAEEIYIPHGTKIVFLSFSCVMITEDEGFVFSKIILDGKLAVLFEGECEEYREVIDSFKKKWKHVL